jgi:hemolysin D
MMKADVKPVEKTFREFPGKLKKLWLPENQHNSDELGFLPAVIELQETPPSPVGRIIIWLIILFFMITLIWAIVGEVDIVAVAHGKIIPSGHSKIIQPVETAVIKVIHVHEGAKVKAGDVLLELDTTLTKADFDNASLQRLSLNNEYQRLSYLLQLLESDVENHSAVIVQANNKLDSLQGNILQNQYLEHTEKLNVLHSSSRQKQSELAAAKSTIRKLEQTLPIVTKRLKSIENLYSQQLASEHKYLELKQQHIEQKQDLEIQYSISKKISHEKNQIKAQIKQYQYEFKRTVMQDIADKELRIKTIDQEIIKTNQRNNLYVLKSPIDGTVQQLNINTIGGVVTPAQALMVIVPEKGQLQVDAFLKNKDIGFVEENQQVEIKIEAFPFTKYGVIEGQIISVSNDAVEHEQLGLVFSMRVDMSQAEINVNGKQVNLTPGMSVSVEVKTGKRNIIDYLVRPIEVAIAGSIKER